MFVAIGLMMLAVIASIIVTITTIRIAVDTDIELKKISKDRDNTSKLLSDLQSENEKLEEINLSRLIDAGNATLTKEEMLTFINHNAELFAHRWSYEDSGNFENVDIEGYDHYCEDALISKVCLDCGLVSRHWKYGDGSLDRSISALAGYFDGEVRVPPDSVKKMVCISKLPLNVILNSDTNGSSIDLKEELVRFEEVIGASK